MLRRSRKCDRVHPDCPIEIRRQIDGVLAANLCSKGVYAGETVVDLVARSCPEVYSIASNAGFELRLDLAENTHAALCKGRVAYQIRKPRTN